MYSNLLVPTDGSKLSDKAVAQAIELAQAIKAKITAFHASADYPMPAYADGISIEMISKREYIKLAKTEAMKILDRVAMKASSAGVECATMRVAAEPWEAILACAKKRAATRSSWLRTVAAVSLRASRQRDHQGVDAQQAAVLVGASTSSPATTDSRRVVRTGPNPHSSSRAPVIPRAASARRHWRPAADFGPTRVQCCFPTKTARCAFKVLSIDVEGAGEADVISRN